MLTALALCLLPLSAAGQPAAPLQLLPNGRQEYVDTARRIAFQLPVEFDFDTRPHAIEDPPYQVGFQSEDRKIQVRLNVEELSGDAHTNLVTSERVSLWATTYAMNRFARRHPKDVQLSSALPPARAAAVWAIAGQLPSGSRYVAEKSVFIGVPPNHIYVLTMLFNDAALGEALQLVDVLPDTVRIIPP